MDRNFILVGYEDGVPVYVRRDSPKGSAAAVRLSKSSDDSRPTLSEDPRRSVPFEPADGAVSEGVRSEWSMTEPTNFVPLPPEPTVRMIVAMTGRSLATLTARELQDAMARYAALLDAARRAHLDPA